MKLKTRAISVEEGFDSDAAFTSRSLDESIQVLRGFVDACRRLPPLEYSGTRFSLTVINGEEVLHLYVHDAVHIRYEHFFSHEPVCGVTGPEGAELAIKAVAQEDRRTREVLDVHAVVID